MNNKLYDEILEKIEDNIFEDNNVKTSNLLYYSHQDIAIKYNEWVLNADDFGEDLLFTDEELFNFFIENIYKKEN